MLRRSILLTLIASSAPMQARAGEASIGAIAVSVEVVSNCTVSATPITLSAREGVTTQAESAIDVQCGPEQPFTVSLNHGDYADGTTRRAFDSAAMRYLAYDIYRDPARLFPWSDSPEQSASGVTNAVGQARLKAYGSLRTTQAISPGKYADRVVVTINF